MSKRRKETYGEFRRRVGPNYDEPTPDINRPIHDRSSVNDSSEMRSQARSDLWRAQRAVQGPQEDLDYINKHRREKQKSELRELKRLSRKYGRQRRR